MPGTPLLFTQPATTCTPDEGAARDPVVGRGELRRTHRRGAAAHEATDGDPALAIGRRRVLGRVLRTFREQHAARPSQIRVGEWADLHRNYVSSAERGERNVAFLALTRWLAALGVSWTEFGAAVDAALAEEQQSA